jgi:CBS-domain-containing membrane protein
MTRTLINYFAKMKGTTKSPPGVGAAEIAWSWVGAFLGMAVVGHIHYNVLAGTSMMMMIASFAASSVLIYGVPKSPLAQPRNVFGGHVLSAIVGVVCYKVLGQSPWFACAVAAATVIAVMHLTKTVHPPAGATALIAIMGDERVHNLGFLYPIIPVGAGITILLIVALLVNNIPKTRRYPEFWL